MHIWCFLKRQTLTLPWLHKQPPHEHQQFAHNQIPSTQSERTRNCAEYLSNNYQYLQRMDDIKQLALSGKSNSSTRMFG